MRRDAKSLQAKAKRCKVDHGDGRGRFVVHSPSGNDYVVVEREVGFECSCRWGDWNDTRFRPCSHVLAVENYLERVGDRELSFWTTKEDARRQHRPRKWVGVGLIATSRV